MKAEFIKEWSTEKIDKKKREITFLVTIDMDKIKEEIRSEVNG